MHSDAITVIRKALTPPDWGDDVSFTVRNTYVVSWIIIAVCMPLIAAFWLAVTPMRPVTAVIGVTLFVIAVTQIVTIRSGRFDAGIPIIMLAGWAMLTYAGWRTGGIASPSLPAQFVFVVFAELCHGPRWGVAMLGASLATIGGFAWAQAAGVTPVSLLPASPFLFAGIVAVYLCALFLLEVMLSSGMRAAHRRLATELADRKQLSSRLRDVIDNAPFGAFICELNDAEELMIVQTNAAACDLLRRSAWECVGGTAEQAFPSMLGSPLMAQARSIAELGGSFDATEEFDGADGRPLVLEMHAFRIAPRTLAVFFTDVTQKRRDEALIRHAAYHDDLTGLPNRKLLVDRLAMALAGANRRHSHVAVLFIDLDNFKPINDELGHAFGDELLKLTGRRLARTSRVSDTVARFGGDEFTILMPDVETTEQATKLADKLIEAFHEPFEIQGKHITVTLSIGVAISEGADDEADRVLEHADRAMYQMKRAGRDGHQVYPREEAEYLLAE